MKPRFEPDVKSDVQTGAKPGFTPTRIDPEAYDASEQIFAASLEQTTSSNLPRFVVEEEAPEVPAQTKSGDGLPEAHGLGPAACAAETQELGVVAPSSSEAEEQPDHESWRREVAARLSHYRARRRPREPRYPSLQLKFDSEPVRSAPVSSAEPLPAAPGVQEQEVENGPSAAVPRIRLAEPVEYPRLVFAASNEATAKVIEFASYSAAPRPIDELAEPVLDRPRIMEAPELQPPPPALGGISIEPEEEPENERRPGFEIPLQAAPMVRRVAAAGTDALLVMSAISAFVYIVFRITAEVPPPAKAAEAVAILIGAFWSAYQYLLLVYSGATPGLKLARLELQMFDGDPVPRRIRRWRVLASVLSGVSLGLGYAWCLLDEDELCWHDRITRTYMAPRK